MEAIRHELFADRRKKGELSASSVPRARLMLVTVTLDGGCKMMKRVILVESRAESRKHFRLPSELSNRHHIYKHEGQEF